MNKERRSAIVTLFAGAVAGVAALMAARGFKGAGKLAARFGKPARSQAKTEYYGYKEINLS